MMIRYECGCHTTCYLETVRTISGYSEPKQRYERFRICKKHDQQIREEFAKKLADELLQKKKALEVDYEKQMKNIDAELNKK